MSNQCSNLFNYRSFNLFPPFHTPLKPYASTLRPVFPFHCNLILIGRRSGNRTSSLLPPLAAESSSNVVLVATTEHHDGSLVFRFGDPSELVKNVERVEETESKAEWESNVVKISDGDQERQVVQKTIEGDYESGDSRLTEVADEITNEDIDSDITERETNVNSDLRDYNAESIHTSKEEVLSSQFDAKTNESLEGVESTLDETECTAQLNEDESLKPTISLLDDSPNRDKTVDPKGTLSKEDDDDDDETEDQSVSIKLESIQASDNEAMDAKQPNSENELHKVETEDAGESNTEDLMSPAIIHMSEVEVTDTANEDVNEELQDMNINGAALIDEMPPSDPLGAEPLDEVSQLQSADVKVETTMEVSSTEAMDVKDRTMENELQEVSTNKSDENDVSYVMPVSCVEEEAPILEDKFQPTAVELQPSMPVSEIELKDAMSQNPDDVILQTNNESEDLSVSVKLETMQVEVMDVTLAQTDELPKVESDDTSMSDNEDVPPQVTMYTSDSEIMDTANEDMEEKLQDMNTNEGTLIDEMPATDSSGTEPVLDDLSQLQLADVKLEATMEASTTKEMDVKDVEDELQQVSIEEAEPILEEDVSQPQSIPLELKPTMQVSDIEFLNTLVQNLDDGVLQVIDETEDLSESVKIEAMQVSDIELPNTMVQNPDDGVLQGIDETEDPLESFKLESMQVSDIEVMDELLDVETEDARESDAKDLLHISDVELTEAANENVEEGLQDMSINEGSLIEPISKMEVIQPSSTPVEIKPTMEVSDIEGENVDDGILQVIDEDADDSYIKDVEQLMHRLEAQLVQDEGQNHNILKQIDALGSSILLEEDANGSQLEAERMEGKVSSSDAEASKETEILLATEAKVEREENYLTGYFLSSGAALLEHPFEALTGGDDAYFMSSSKWLGVANGVSQWSFEGTDPGVYAQELMRTCEEIVLNTTNASITNSVDLLCRCVKETNMSGSSNILIANFDGQALHVANIGDTGFLIIRHGAVYKKSSPLLHEFHFALQVEDRDDPLQLVEEYTIELEEGDIVVSATDGLFDNLYEPEIAMVVSKSLQAGMKPEEVANVLATRAQEVGRSAYVRSPFSDAAQAAGYTGYTGGKQDNVAVIVSLVENRSNLL
ncbi:hypothetical protein L2E82_01797 [Cichorium intybus]|uniref:Uncharacterized protein n=1 Tax=Cichorium intybus TaxID=13427 RepID=A0ACB9H0N5_CICIN|nr:hypothetical protein L2E82_01797 [Cichorium intybus]